MLRMGPPDALGTLLSLLPLQAAWGNQPAGAGLKAGQGRAAGCTQPSLDTGSCHGGAEVPKELNHASK